MIEILNILIPYILGCIVSFLIAHPVREWKEGYECAKARYANEIIYALHEALEGV